MDDKSLELIAAKVEREKATTIFLNYLSTIANRCVTLLDREIEDNKPKR